MNLPEEDRRKIIEWAKRHSEIKRVYLYGSRARRDNRPESDIDLAIEMSSYGDWSNWHSDYEENPDLHLSVEVHLEWYQSNAGLERVGKGVERDGVLIYPEMKR